MLFFFFFYKYIIVLIFFTLEKTFGLAEQHIYGRKTHNIFSDRHRYKKKKKKQYNLYNESHISFITGQRSKSVYVCRNGIIFALLLK